MKKLTLTLLVLVLLIGSCLNAFAEGSVTYDGNAQDFIFEPGSVYSPTDLFPDFKSVMPGDSLTDQVLVKNDPAKGVKINVYMRALGAVEGEDLLSQMTLTVKQNGGATLFEAPANETAQLTDWVSLGTLAPGGEVLLDVTLNVPIEMGNEFAYRVGKLDWQFKIEELPEEKPTPPTGDNFALFGYIALAIAMLAVILLVVSRRKQKESE